MLSHLPGGIYIYFLIALLSPASRSGLLYAATYTVSYHVNSTPGIFVHLWSLSVEEQFYLLWPLALLLGFRRRAWVAWFAMLAAASFRLLIALSGVSHPGVYLHYSFLGTMDSIAAGCLLAIYEPQIRERYQWMVGSNAVAVAVPVTAWTLNVTLLHPALSVFWGAVPLLIAMWVFLLIERRDWILNNTVASGGVGVLSYSLYLWQQGFTLGSKYSAITALLMLAGCAIASYLLVEKPMLRLGAWITSRKPARDYLGGGKLVPRVGDQTSTSVAGHV